MLLISKQDFIKCSINFLLLFLLNFSPQFRIKPVNFSTITIWWKKQGIVEIITLHIITKKLLEYDDTEFLILLFHFCWHEIFLLPQTATTKIRPLSIFKLLSISPRHPYLVDVTHQATNTKDTRLRLKVMLMPQVRVPIGCISS